MWLTEVVHGHQSKPTDCSLPQKKHCSEHAHTIDLPLWMMLPIVALLMSWNWYQV